LVANGYLKSKGIQRAMSRDIRLVQSLKDLPKRKGLTIKKPFFRTIMALIAHYDMDVKTAFLNGDIEETIYMM